MTQPGVAPAGGAAVTVRTVLFGAADPAVVLALAPGWRGVLDRVDGVLTPVSAAGRSVVDRELTAVLSGLLGLDLGQVLIGGWLRHRALLAAARVTRANPTATELVQLAPHRISTAHRPYVDIVVDGVKLAEVHFDLGLIVDVDGLLATVRQERLVTVQGGRCAVTASLACEGYELAQRRSVLDPAATVCLGTGIALLPVLAADSAR
jgi:hypothetical protein